MPIDKRCSRFFRRSAGQWGIVEFLNYHQSKYKPRWVLHRWRKDLEMIRKSGNEEQRKRASMLLRRYKEKRNGSDHRLGCVWLSRQLDQQRNQSQGNSGVHFTATVTIGNAGFQASQSHPLRATRVHRRHGDGTIDAFECGGAEIEESEYQESTHRESEPRESGHRESEPRESEHRESGHRESGHRESQHRESEHQESQHQGAKSPDRGPPHMDHPLAHRSPSFYQTYHEMAPGRKWVLTTGRAVEDVIFAACNAMDDKTFARSLGRWFVLDTEDTRLMDWFEDVEWNEITATVLPLPKQDEVMATFLSRFREVNSTAKFREELEKQSYLPENAIYDPDIHFNSHWANLVLGRLLMLYESPRWPGDYWLKSGDWYRSFVWYSILDECLLDLSGVTLVHPPTACIATTLRINRHRDSLSIRANRATTLGTIIREFGVDPKEYGVIAVQQDLTFWFSRPIPPPGASWEIHRALRDMLHRLHEVANGREEVTRRVQVVGVGISRMDLRYVRMGYPGVGYVCWLQREKEVRMPEEIGYGLVDAVDVLLRVAQLKEVIRESVEAIRTRGDGLTAEQFPAAVPVGTASCGWAPDSP